MKRVGIVFMLSSAGGVQSCVLSLTRRLNRLGIVPDLLWDVAPSQSLLEDAKASVRHVPLAFRIPTRLIQKLPETLRYAAWIANALEADHLKGAYDHLFVFHNGLVVSRDTPHVYYLSGPPLLPQLEASPRGVLGLPIKLFRAIYRSVLWRKWPAYEFHEGRNYVINSIYTADLFEAAHGVRLPVVYPPVDVTRFGDCVPALEGRDGLLFFSRIAPYKRPEMVLDLARMHPNLRCVIMGGVSPNQRVYAEKLRVRARKDGIRASFVFNPGSDVIERELSRARYYVFPAKNEHFGMTTPEAISAGALPYVHDSGGQREIVPLDALRFTDSEFLDKFSQLLQQSSETQDRYRRQLMDHVRTFSEDAYCDEMLRRCGLEG